MLLYPTRNTALDCVAPWPMEFLQRKTFHQNSSPTIQSLNSSNLPQVLIIFPEYTSLNSKHTWQTTSGSQTMTRYTSQLRCFLVKLISSLTLSASLTSQTSGTIPLKLCLQANTWLNSISSLIASTLLISTRTACWIRTWSLCQSRSDTTRTAKPSVSLSAIPNHHQVTSNAQESYLTRRISSSSLKLTLLALPPWRIIITYRSR